MTWNLVSLKKAEGELIGLNDRETVSHLSGGHSGSVCTSALSSAAAQAWPSACSHSYSYIFSTVSDTGIIHASYDSSKQVPSMFLESACVALIWQKINPLAF